MLTDGQVKILQAGLLSESPFCEAVRIVCDPDDPGLIDLQARRLIGPTHDPNGWIVTWAGRLALEAHLDRRKVVQSAVEEKADPSDPHLLITACREILNAQPDEGLLDAARRVMRERAKTSQGGVPNPVIKKRIDEIGLTVRALNVLQTAGITETDLLCEQSSADLLRLRWFGRKSLQDVQERLGALGLALRGEKVKTPQPSRTCPPPPWRSDRVPRHLRSLTGEEARLAFEALRNWSPLETHAAARRFACPYCGVEPGTPCVATRGVSIGEPLDYHHLPRRTAMRRAVARGELPREDVRGVS